MTDYLIGSVGVEATMDTTKWRKGVNDLKASSQTVNKNLDEIKKNAKSTTGELLGMVAGLAGVGYTIKTSIGSLIAFEDSVDTFGQAFGDNQKEMQTFFDELSRNSRRTKTELYGMAADFKLVFDSMGIANQEGDRLTKMLSTLTVDSASLRNVELPRYIGAINSAITGQYQALKSLGVVMSVERVNTYAYANGIAAAGAELTDYQRALAVSELLTEKLSRSQGNAARSAYQVKEQLNAFKKNINELSIAMGKHLADVVMPFVNALGQMVQHVTQLLTDYPALAKAMAVGGVGLAGAGTAAVGGSIAMRAGASISSTAIGVAVGNSLKPMLGPLKVAGKKTWEVVKTEPWKLSKALQFFGRGVKRSLVDDISRTASGEIGLVKMLRGEFRVIVFMLRHSLKQIGVTITKLLAAPLVAAAIAIGKVVVVLLALRHAAKIVQGFFQGIAGKAIVKGITDLVSGVKNAVTSILTALKNVPVIGNILKMLEEAFRGFHGFLKNFMAAANQFLRYPEAWGKAFSDAVGQMGEKGGIKNFYRNFLVSLEENLSQPTEKIKEELESNREAIQAEREARLELIQGLLDSAPGRTELNEFVEGFGNIINATKTLMDEASFLGSEDRREFGGLIEQSITDPATYIGEDSKTIQKSLTGIVDRMLGDLNQFSGDNGVASAITDYVTGVVPTAGELRRDLKSLFSASNKFVMTAIDEIAEMQWEAINAFREQLSLAIDAGKISDDIANMLNEVLNVASARKLAQDDLEAAEKFANEREEAMRTASDYVSNILGDFDVQSVMQNPEEYKRKIADKLGDFIDDDFIQGFKANLTNAVSMGRLPQEIADMIGGVVGGIKDTQMQMLEEGSLPNTINELFSGFFGKLFEDLNQIRKDAVNNIQNALNNIGSEMYQLAGVLQNYDRERVKRQLTLGKAEGMSVQEYAETGFIGSLVSDMFSRVVSPEEAQYSEEKASRERMIALMEEEVLLQRELLFMYQQNPQLVLG